MFSGIPILDNKSIFDGSLFSNRQRISEHTILKAETTAILREKQDRIP
jgi:hypothetical protein